MDVGRDFESSKRKPREPKNEVKCSMPVVQMNSGPGVKVLPKTVLPIPLKTANSDSDFPALPSRADTSSHGLKMNFSTSALFSKVVTTTPDAQFLNIKPETSDRSTNPSNLGRSYRNVGDNRRTLLDDSGSNGKGTFAKENQYVNKRPNSAGFPSHNTIQNSIADSKVNPVKQQSLKHPGNITSSSESRRSVQNIVPDHNRIQNLMSDSKVNPAVKHHTLKHPGNIISTSESRRSVQNTVPDNKMSAPSRNSQNAATNSKFKEHIVNVVPENKPNVSLNRPNQKHPQNPVNSSNTGEYVRNVVPEIKVNLTSQQKHSRNIDSRDHDPSAVSQKSVESGGMRLSPKLPENVSTSEATRPKRKHKRKQKKSSKLPQGKVNTLSYEQYVAITEKSKSDLAGSAFKSSINDDSEYPALGFPTNIKKSKAVKNEPTVISKMPVEIKKIVSDNKQAFPPSGHSKKEVMSLGVTDKSVSDKKFNSPVQMNLVDMLLQTRKKSEKKTKKFQPLLVKREKIKPLSKAGPNTLDSSGPSRKRGKEREIPKKHKLSKIKKVILKERIEKKLRLAMISESNNEESNSNEVDAIAPDVPSDSDLYYIESEMENLSVNFEQQTEMCLEASTTSLEESLAPSNCQAVEEGENEMKLREKCAKKLLHCRKFREYCTHFISEEIDNLTENLLAELVRYQDRLHLKDPVKARARRRLICGLKEVTRNLKLRKLKLVIVAPDIEEINSEGGLTDALKSILEYSETYNIPLMFSLPRRKLGKVCRKKVALSCVGIFNYEGTEDIYKQLMELVEEARHIYNVTFENAKLNLTSEMMHVLSNSQIHHEQMDQIKRTFWEMQSVLS